MPHLITSLTVKYEDEVVTARQRARRVAAELSFDEQDRTRIATAVSEIVRVFQHRKSMTQVEFVLEGKTAPQLLIIRIAEPPQGRKPSGKAPAGAESPSAADWSVALQAAGRLMDQCEVQPAGGRQAIRLAKLLPKRAPLVTAKAVECLGRQLDKQEPQNPIEEVRQQNQELLHALEELHIRQQELVRLNRELEDTNRGVVALYAELDEKAGHLRRADEMKSRFLSNMSHEFRTPLNAVLALSQLLLDRADGDLTGEQEKQVRYIRKSGEDLLELVNDLLDLAKIEAGKIEIKPVEFQVGNLFSALRGMLRPLLVGNAVNLLFEEADGLPPMRTDEGKVSQILRNFISNAVKFTERGEIRVRAELTGDRQAVVFSVSDTGIGIAEEDQARIFEEFSQIDHPIQRNVKGTGLGLPLCRKLAELLGGTVCVVSRLGVGSTFTAVIPTVYVEPMEDEGNLGEPPAVQPAAGLVPVLVVEDEPETRLLYEKYLRRTAFQMIPAGSIFQAREQLRRHRVAAIVLDVLLPDESAWQWLAELKGDERTKHIPVFIVSSIEDQRKGLALGADDYALKPARRDWLLERLERATGTAAGGAHEPPLALIIDDQEADRYIIRRHLGESGCAIVEAAGGEEGFALARRLKPALILLDLNMPEPDGFEVLAQLGADETTADIPVAVVTSLTPTPDQQGRLGRATAVLDKSALSPAALKRLVDGVPAGGLSAHDSVGR